MPVCPLCNQPATTVLRTFDIANAAELFCPEMVSREIYARMREILARLWKQNLVHIVRCGACNFGFSDPFVAGDAEFYGLQAPDTPYPCDKWEYRRTLGVLSGLERTVSSVLDVGAGRGHFLRQLVARGWSPDRLQATEFSSVGAASIERLGIACHRSDLRALAGAGRLFDAVCLFQVLEHLDGYDDLLQSLGQLTTPDAHLFIAVPNGHRVAFNEQVGLQYDCPPNHISRWTPDSFQVFARKYGWLIETIEFEPSPSMLQEAKYGAVHRFLRNSHLPGSWARWSYDAADRWFPRSTRRNRAVKAAAMLLSPDAWRAGVQVALAARGGAIPHALWVHLRKA